MDDVGVSLFQETSIWCCMCTFHSQSNQKNELICISLLVTSVVVWDGKGILIDEVCRPNPGKVFVPGGWLICDYIINVCVSRGLLIWYSECNCSRGRCWYFTNACHCFRGPGWFYGWFETNLIVCFLLVSARVREISGTKCAGECKCASEWDFECQASACPSASSAYWLRSLAQERERSVRSTSKDDFCFKLNSVVGASIWLVVWNILYFSIY